MMSPPIVRRTGDLSVARDRAVSKPDLAHELFRGLPGTPQENNNPVRRAPAGRRRSRPRYLPRGETSDQFRLGCGVTRR